MPAHTPCVPPAPPAPRCRPARRLGWVVAVALAAALAGCAAPKSGPRPSGLPERFDSEEVFSRLIPGSVQQSCEAARRALLSQGYILLAVKPDTIDAKKSFQPTAEYQQDMTIRVVCLPDTPPEEWSQVFVTAVKDTYTVKKSATSASVGLGGIGSVSLPFASTSEALVKVGSETVSTPAFYDSFYDLVRRYLSESTASTGTTP